MSKTKRIQETVTQEDVLQAVVIADNFRDVFENFDLSENTALLPLVNIPLLEYCLDFLLRSGVQETIIFCCSNAASIKEYVSKSKWIFPGSPMSVNIVVSERCFSLGDCLRDLDNKALIKGDFVLVSPNTVATFDLQSVLDYHKQQCKKDKGTAMTLIRQDVGATVMKHEETIVATDGQTNQLLFYNKPASTTSKINLPLEFFNTSSNINISSTTRDSGVAICSPSVPLLFSDNFDYQTKDDFIRGLLMNEEILQSHIYNYILTNGYGIVANDWASYQRASHDVVHRWTYPLVLDQFTRGYKHLRNCIYKQGDVHIARGCNLIMDVVVGDKSKIAAKTKIIRSVIGQRCVVGENCVVEDAFLLDDSVIEDGCKLKLCVVGHRAVVRKNSKLSKCLIHKDVVIENGSNLNEATIASQDKEGEGEKLSSAAYLLKKSNEDDESDEGVENRNNVGLVDVDDLQPSDCEDDASSLSDEDVSYTQSVEHEDTTLFYNEVLDSLQRGYDEKLICDNLILEINSSRYAYNVTLSEVNQLTVKAVLRLPQPVKSSLNYFLPLLKNYIKNKDAMNDCLTAFEESEDHLGTDIAKYIHFLYDNDILTEEVILKWFEDLENTCTLRKRMAPLVKWLKEAAEETSSEDE